MWGCEEYLMGQDEVYKYLKKVKKPCTRKEISKALKIGRGSVGNSLSKLFKFGEVQREEIKEGQYSVYKYWI